MLSVEGIRQYLAYIIKCMELAMKYQWRSVLVYDDYFRQIQAFYDVPWVYESHHLHTVKLEPLPLPGQTSTRTRGLKSTCSRSNNFNSAEQAEYTSEGRVSCRSYNQNPNGCTFHSCKFVHACSKNVEGKACENNHPSCKHAF